MHDFLTRCGGDARVVAVGIRDELIVRRQPHIGPGVDGVVQHRVHHPAVEYDDAAELPLADAVEIQRGAQVLALYVHDADRAAVEPTPLHEVAEALPDLEPRERGFEVWEILLGFAGGDGDAGSRHVFGDRVDHRADHPGAAVRHLQEDTVTRHQVEIVGAGG
jgi:hypothetical protein